MPTRLGIPQARNLKTNGNSKRRSKQKRGPLESVAPRVGGVAEYINLFLQVIEHVEFLARVEWQVWKFFCRGSLPPKFMQPLVLVEKHADAVFACDWIKDLGRKTLDVPDSLIEQFTYKLAVQGVMRSKSVCRSEGEPWHRGIAVFLPACKSAQETQKVSALCGLAFEEGVPQGLALDLRIGNIASDIWFNPRPTIAEPR
jgi:hypothetical protein